MNEMALKLRLVAHPFCGEQISDETRNTLIKAAEEIERLHDTINRYVAINLRMCIDPLFEKGNFGDKAMTVPERMTELIEASRSLYAEADEHEPA